MLHGFKGMSQFAVNLFITDNHLCSKCLWRTALMVLRTLCDISKMNVVSHMEGHKRIMTLVLLCMPECKTTVI